MKQDRSSSTFKLRYNISMEKKIIAGVIAFAVIAVFIGLMIPVQQQPPGQTFPWQVKKTPQGQTQVFGVIPGQSTLREAERAFRASAELSLFVPANRVRQPVVEAYFDKVSLGGLSAKVVLVIGFSEQQLQAMHDRGVRISTLGDGSRKVTLSTQDIATVLESPVSSITYLPRIRLESTLLEKRFGQPAQIVTEKEGNMAHWLYPDLGLDVALDEKGNAVLQYVAPTQFEQLITPLRQLKQ